VDSGAEVSSVRQPCSSVPPEFSNDRSGKHVACKGQSEPEPERPDSASATSHWCVRKTEENAENGELLLNVTRESQIALEDGKWCEARPFHSATALISLILRQGCFILPDCTRSRMREWIWLGTETPFRSFSSSGQREGKHDCGPNSVRPPVLEVVREQSYPRVGSTTCRRWDSRLYTAAHLTER
jgi:hypothetical protein